VVMATHDVSMSQRSTVRFLELHNGRLVYDGTDASRLIADRRAAR